jgi:hypothetical protein
MVTTKIVSLVNTVFYSLTASIGNLIVNSDEKKRYEVYQTMQAISMMLSIFTTTCLLLLLSDFIYIWLGEDFILEKLVILAVVVNFYFSVILLPIWVFREATGLYRKTRFIMLATAVVNIVASIVMGKLFGLAGIIFATSFARLVTYFWYEPKLLFKEYFGKSCRLFFASFIKNIILTIATISVCYVATSWINVNSWRLLILKSVMVGIISLFLVVLVYGKSEGCTIIYKKLKNVANKMKPR